MAYTDTTIITLLTVANHCLQILCYYLATTAYGTKPHATVQDPVDIWALEYYLTPPQIINDELQNNSSWNDI